VKQLKNRPDYKPAADYYKVLRDKIKEIHEDNLDKSKMYQSLEGIKNENKVEHFKTIIEGYRKWWGKKTFIWFNPPAAIYSKHGVNISINPELGLKIKGKPHLVKLYFKANPLLKNKIDIITHLMSISLLDQSPANTVMSVLDVRQSKLIPLTTATNGLTAILNAELSYISALWESM
jgi:hypothetical protein